MIKNTKKIVSIIVALMMVMSCCTALVFTANAETTDALTVTASSNLAESVTTTYSQDNSTVNIKLNLQSQKAIVNGEYEITYDATKLSLTKSFEGDAYSDFTPEITTGGVINTIEPGHIVGNFSSPDKPYSFLTEKALFDITFNVIGTGEAVVDFKMLEMDYIDTDTSDTTMMVLGGEVLDTFKQSSSATFGMSEPVIVPTETTPTETTPTESNPTDPTETSPTDPTETSPTDPTETNPTDPTETNPTETNPTETNPTETNPTETNPTAPTETNPTETNPTDPEPQVNLGDVDLDGYVNVKDATLIQLYAAHFNTLTEQQFKNADVDEDLDVNVKDATQIQLLVAHLIEAFVKA